MRIRLVSFVLCLLFAALSLPPAMAAERLYTGEAVMGEGLSMQGAQLAALDQVLTRLTGQVDRSLVSELGLGAADLRALQASQQRAQVERLMPDGSRQEQVVLRVDFYPPAVDNLLRSNQLPRLGRERPAVLFWLARRDASPDALMAPELSLPAPLGEEAGDADEADIDAYLQSLLVRASSRFGIDLIEPLGDALDLSMVNQADIRGGILDGADALRDRYGAGMVAMLDLAQDEFGDWRGRWFWRLEGRDHSLSVTDPDLDAVVDEGLAGLLAVMAERFAVRLATDPGGLRRIRVEGLVDQRQYSAVVNHLAELSVVERVQVVSARERAIEFDLELAGDGLEDQIGFSRLLAIEGEDAAGTLVLRWQR
ncbi:MAG: DUF2066 domain-containing protein [Wenzhouxiangella sp.]